MPMAARELIAKYGIQLVVDAVDAVATLADGELRLRAAWVLSAVREGWDLDELLAERGTAEARLARWEAERVERDRDTSRWRLRESLMGEWRGAISSHGRPIRLGPQQTSRERRRGGTAIGFEGTWRIVEMDAWDVDDADSMGPAAIEFGSRDDGRFRFIAVHGWMDCRYAERDGRPLVEFTWEGHDEGDPISGRGWAVLEPGGVLRGQLYLHLADDSGFQAVRADPEQVGL